MKKILLVDDEPHVIKVLKMFLDKNGYEVTVANNGIQAMVQVASLKPDVVITDVQMPKMNGQQLCERIINESRGSSPLIIVMTSRTDQDLRTWVKSIPNLEFLEKPLSPRKLVNYLRNHFQSEGTAEGAAA